MAYVKDIQLEHFDPEALSLYWRFVAERQAIYARRLAGQQWPWTQDSIMQVEFITNMYRELDPGTQYVMTDILGSGQDEINIIFNVMLYRLMGSQAETHRHLGFQKYDAFSVDEMVDRLAALPDTHRIFGDAYRVAGYHDEGGANKVENVARMFAYIAGGMEEYQRRINTARRVREVFEVFQGIKGFGEFLAHQVTVDLLYPLPSGDPIVPFGQDEWAQAGPGARRGIWSLMSEGVQLSNLTQVMEWLRDNQQEQFESRGLYMAYILDDDEQPVLLSLCNIQSTLCEFYKYIRLWRGEKKVNVRKYERDLASNPITGPPVMLPGDSATFMDPALTCFTSAVERLSIEEPEDQDSSTLLSGEEYEPDLDRPREGVSIKQDGGPPSMPMRIEPVPGLAIYISINVWPSSAEPSAST